MKATLSTSSWEAMAAPAVGPNPGIILTTPGGKPACGQTVRDTGRHSPAPKGLDRRTHTPPREAKAACPVPRQADTSPWGTAQEFQMAQQRTCFSGFPAAIVPPQWHSSKGSGSEAQCREQVRGAPFRLACDEVRGTGRRLNPCSTNTCPTLGPPKPLLSTPKEQACTRALRVQDRHQPHTSLSRLAT